MESSIAFSPTVNERELDKEVRKVDESLSDVGNKTLSPNVDVDGVGGVGGGRGLMSGEGEAGGKLSSISEGVGGLSSTISDKLPGTMTGVSASSVMPVAMAGAAGLGMAAAMHSASSHLQATSGMFSTAMKMFFRPFGDFLGEALRPMAQDMISFASDFNSVVDSKGLSVGVAWLSSNALSGLGAAIGNVLTGKADLGDIILTGTATFAAAKVIGLYGTASFAASQYLGMTGSLGVPAGGKSGVLRMTGALVVGAGTYLVMKDALNLQASDHLAMGGVLTVSAASALAVSGVLSLPAASVLAVTGGITIAASEIFGINYSPGPVDHPGVQPNTGTHTGEDFMTPGEFTEWYNSQNESTSDEAELTEWERLQEQSQNSTWNSFDDTPELATGGTVEATGVAKVHKGEVVSDPEQLMRELATAFNDSGGAGGRESVDTSKIESKLDRLHRDFRDLARAMSDMDLKVDGETFGRATTSTRRNSVTDTDPMT